MNHQIPKDWKWVKLKDISESIQYGYTESSSKEIVGPKFLRITDIQENKVVWDEVPYCKIDKHTQKKYLLKDGDLVFARTGATVGKSFLLKGIIPEAIFASYLIRVRVSKEINKKYLSNFFHSTIYWAQITEGQVGIGQPNVNGNKLGQLNLPLPPKPTQLAIVSKIEELFSEIENGIKSLLTAQQQLKTYRQSVLKWAFEGKLTNSLNYDSSDLDDEHALSIAAESDTEYKIKKNQGNQKNHINHSSDKGELPEGWAIKKLNEIGIWRGGGTPSKANKAFWEKGNILWVSPKDMKSKIIYDTIDKITPEAIEYSSTKLVDKGSILFVVRSGILRRTLPVAITVCNVTINQDLQAFTPKHVLPDYVYWYVQSKNEDIRRDCSKDGTTVESIESSLLKNYTIPICSNKEQELIVQEIESRLSVADKMEDSINQSMQQAEALKQSILKKAFEGKLI